MRTSRVSRSLHQHEEVGEKEEVATTGPDEQEFANTLERWDMMVMRTAASEPEEIIPPAPDTEPAASPDAEKPAPGVSLGPVEKEIPAEPVAGPAISASTEQTVTVGQESAAGTRHKRTQTGTSGRNRKGRTSGGKDTSKFSISFSTNLGGNTASRRREARSTKEKPKASISYRVQPMEGRAAEETGRKADQQQRGGGLPGLFANPQPFRPFSRSLPDSGGTPAVGPKESGAERSDGQGAGDERPENDTPRTAGEAAGEAPAGAGAAEVPGQEPASHGEGTQQGAAAAESSSGGGPEEAAPGKTVVEPTVADDGTEAKTDSAPREDEYGEVADSIVLPALPPMEHDLSESAQRSRSGYRRSMLWGFLLLLLGFGGFGAWAVLAPLKSGVVAPGSIKVAGERKTVQHLEGGIIQKLFVKEGDQVQAGQVLVRLEGKRARANLRAKTMEYYTLLARGARLKAEKEGRDQVSFPKELTSRADNPTIRKIMDAERNLFTSRRVSIQDQLNLYKSWSEGYRREIDGLKAQRTAAMKQLVTIKDELGSVETLYKKGLIDKPRLLALKRTAAGLKGQIGSYNASIAKAEQKIGETELRGITLQTQRKEEIAEELQKTEAAIRDIREQMPALVDRVKRLDILAPRSGRVVDLRYHTPGGVINAASPIMDIVPEDDTLIIEARIKPTDIDIVTPGVEALIQLTAYNQRQTPQIPGQVINVSADRLEDPKTGDPYYLAMVEIDQKSLRDLSNVKLYPGMPATVQIVAGERTPLDYLLGPLESAVRRTWLEQ